jgi:mono/diheme cytochrome c family protein
MSDGLLRLLSSLAFLGVAVIAVDAQAANIERGRQLYENHCKSCHTAQVHGRKNRTALSIGDLREIIDRWQSNQGLRWRPDEIEDVLHYLANTRYFFITSR